MSLFFEEDEDDMYDYFPGEFVYGDEMYVEDEYLDEKWWYTNDPDYMISSHGRVWSVKKQKFLKLRKGDKHGHKNISTHGKYPYVHRLVAKAFIPNPNNYPYVRHIYDEPDDNYYRRLAWGTQKDNHEDCVRNGHYHAITPEEREKGLDKARRPVLATNLKTGEQISFRSINGAARELGVQSANIGKVLNGKRSHTCRWFFEYLPKECDY